MMRMRWKGFRGIGTTRVNQWDEIRPKTHPTDGQNPFVLKPKTCSIIGAPMTCT